MKLMTYEPDGLPFKPCIVHEHTLNADECTCIIVADPFHISQTNGADLVINHSFGINKSVRHREGKNAKTFAEVQILVHSFETLRVISVSVFLSALHFQM